MEEIWKDIKFTDTNGKEYDYTGLYQVSNMGRVRSIERYECIQILNALSVIEFMFGDR